MQSQNSISENGKSEQLNVNWMQRNKNHFYVFQCYTCKTYFHFLLVWISFQLEWWMGLVFTLLQIRNWYYPAKSIELIHLFVYLFIRFFFFAIAHTRPWIFNPKYGNQEEYIHPFVHKMEVQTSFWIMCQICKMKLMCREKVENINYATLKVRVKIDISIFGHLTGTMEKKVSIVYFAGTRAHVETLRCNRSTVLYFCHAVESGIFDSQKVI